MSLGLSMSGQTPHGAPLELHCASCGRELDPRGYLIHVQGIVGVFHSVECALQVYGPDDGDIESPPARGARPAAARRPHRAL